jgi:hypothetical protein
MRNKIIFIFLFLGIVFAQKQNMSIKVADGSKYKNVKHVELNGDQLVFQSHIKRLSKSKYETIDEHIVDIQKISILEKRTFLDAFLGISGIAFGLIEGFFGLYVSSSGGGEPGIGLPIIVGSCLIIFQSIKLLFNEKEISSVNFNDMSLNKKKVILEKLISPHSNWQ